MSHTDAARHLDYLRGGTEQYDFYIRELRKGVVWGTFTLADLGTSEAELEQLRVLGCKTVAAEHLGNLQPGSDQYDFHIRSIRKQLVSAGLTLADIGTSEEELASKL